MGLFTTRIRDARGRAVKQLDPVLMHLLRRTDGVPADVLRRMAEDLDRRWARRGYLIAGVYLMGLVLVYAGMFGYKAFVSSTRSFDYVGIVFLLIQFVCLAGGFVASWVISLRMRSRRIRSVMLKNLRCPHCVYDLQGTAPDEEDSAVVCPECGSAWLIDSDNWPTKEPAGDGNDLRGGDRPATP